MSCVSVFECSGSRSLDCATGKGNVLRVILNFDAVIYPIRLLQTGLYSSRESIISFHVAAAEADSRQIASQAQFLGVQFAAVVLVGLLVRVERCATDTAVHISATLHVTTISSLQHKLVFTCRALHT